MPQFGGGYIYPGRKICLVASLLSLLASGVVWVAMPLSAAEGLGLVLALEGTVLWATSFTPHGLMPPPPGIVAKLRWLFAEQSATAVSFNQPMFYLGVLFVLVSCILTAAGSR